MHGAVPSPPPHPMMMVKYTSGGHMLYLAPERQITNRRLLRGRRKDATKPAHAVGLVMWLSSRPDFSRIRVFARPPTCIHVHPRHWGVFSVITFVPRYLHAANGVCAFRPTTRSRPRLGLVVRCGDLALSQKTCLFVRFFTYSQKM